MIHEMKEGKGAITSGGCWVGDSKTKDRINEDTSYLLSFRSCL